MKIIRVFPRQTSFTPIDDLAYIGMPPKLFTIPEHDEIHVSCTFTWDKETCEFLQLQWQGVTDKPVKLGGPAYKSHVDDFQQGLYLKSNIIFTTRGCNNNCPWCGVPDMEGRLREIPICQGNIIQDNNFLQSSRAHKEKVFDMLKTQKGICFRGGLEADLIDDHFIAGISNLSIKELWLACDTDGSLPKFKKSVEKLKLAGYKREKINTYVLIGDDMDKNEARLRVVYEVGTMPFAQLKRDFSDTKTVYKGDWNKFARMWSRPAAIKAHVEKGTDFHNFNT